MVDPSEMREDERYYDDSLIMSSETDAEDMKEFVRRRIQDPHVLNGKTIWDFSNHKPNMEALEFATSNKLENDRYVIPFQVRGTWSMMMTLLPEEIQMAELLVYKPEYNDYAAYANLLAQMDEEEVQDFRAELRDLV